MASPSYLEVAQTFVDCLRDVLRDDFDTAGLKAILAFDQALNEATKCWKDLDKKKKLNDWRAEVRRQARGPPPELTPEEVESVPLPTQRVQPMSETLHAGGAQRTSPTFDRSETTPTMLLPLPSMPPPPCPFDFLQPLCENHPTGFSQVDSSQMRAHETDGVGYEQFRTHPIHDLRNMVGSVDVLASMDQPPAVAAVPPSDRAADSRSSCGSDTSTATPPPVAVARRSRTRQKPKWSKMLQ